MSNEHEIDRGYRLLGLLLCAASGSLVGFAVGVMVGRMLR